MLKWGDPFLLGVLVPAVAVVALGLLPYVLPNAKSENLGRWFPRGNRVAQILAALIILAIFALDDYGSYSPVSHREEFRYGDWWSD